MVHHSLRFSKLQRGRTGEVMVIGVSCLLTDGIAERVGNRCEIVAAAGSIGALENAHVICV
jgi:hypothetical protein